MDQIKAESGSLGACDIGGAGFCGIGNWQGVAEVYDGGGRFLGNGVDQRHVRSQQSDGRTRIDLSFVGPLKFAGHYVIEDHGAYRLYQGPVNCGYAEALGKDGVSAHAYWPVTGLSQKFFLMMAPDGLRQMSLALMSRGEQLLYVIVGENGKIVGDVAQVSIPLVNGGVHDLQSDPTAGRPTLLLHRNGYWEGEVYSTLADGRDGQCLGARQTILNEGGFVNLTLSGSRFAKADLSCCLTSNDWQAWTEAGDFVGSYSLYGGRASSGQFHVLSAERRLWRREVVSGDGQYKAMVHIWYRGEERIGMEWGVLKFRPSEP